MGCRIACGLVIASLSFGTVRPTAAAPETATAIDDAAAPSSAPPSTDGAKAPHVDEPWVVGPPMDPLPGPRHHRALTGLGLGAVYLTLGTWAYFAWYYNKPDLPAFKVGGDGWFGRRTYAGGADKLGHFWGNLTFSRLTTDLLRRGGWGPWSSSVLASSLCFTFFVFVEIKDGYYYEMSPGDLVGDAGGALFSMVMTNWPALDRAIDFRVQWTPSAQYRSRFPGDIDFVEDYSGQTYLLAWKPRSLAVVRDTPWLRPLGYIDPVIGYGTRNYKPPGATEPRKQELFVGVALDLQTVFDDALGGRRSRAARAGHSMAHTFFELAQLPYTSAPVLETTRTTP